MSGMSCVTTRGERRMLTFLFELDKDIPQKDGHGMLLMQMALSKGI